MRILVLANTGESYEALQRKLRSMIKGKDIELRFNGNYRDMYLRESSGEKIIRQSNDHDLTFWEEESYATIPEKYLAFTNKVKNLFTFSYDGGTHQVSTTYTY